MNIKQVSLCLTLATFLSTASLAQTPPPGAVSAPGRGAAGRGGGGFGAGYNPRPPADHAQVERGKGFYSINCTFCHGVDARGGEGGPNLLRSQLVLDDIKGELIAPVIEGGLPDRGMPPIKLNSAQAVDVAVFIHSLGSGGRDPVRNAPQTIVTGDAKAGEFYFRLKCAACHAVTGDLKGLASRVPDPKALQHLFLAPGGGGFSGGRGSGPISPKTVTVTFPNRTKAEGTLERIDDFEVTISEASGASRTILRKGDVPKVEVHDPLLAHKRLLPVYTDKDIHNLTAYLVTLK